MRIEILALPGQGEVLAGTHRLRAQLGESVNDQKAAIDETRRSKRTMSKYAREVTEKDFDQIVSQSKTPVLVDF
jgi:hypothetical protein